MGWNIHFLLHRPGRHHQSVAMQFHPEYQYSPGINVAKVAVKAQSLSS